MTLDTSAILAILFGEPERDGFAAAVSEASVRLVSTVNALEAAIAVHARKGPPGGRELDLFLHVADIDIVSFTNEHLTIARQAYHRFGKGRHRAALNLGDCCAYALSRHSGEPLLYKGDDFSRTDVHSAL